MKKPIDPSQLRVRRSVKGGKKSAVVRKGNIKVYTWWHDNQEYPATTGVVELNGPLGRIYIGSFSVNGNNVGSVIVKYSAVATALFPYDVSEDDTVKLYKEKIEMMKLLVSLVSYVGR